MRASVPRFLGLIWPIFELAFRWDWMTVLAIVSIWLLLNVLFVLIVVPPRGSRSRLNRSGTILAPAPIEKHQDQLITTNNSPFATLSDHSQREFFSS
jgi:hypothetical protein